MWIENSLYLNTALTQDKFLAKPLWQKLSLVDYAKLITEIVGTMTTWLTQSLSLASTCCGVAKMKCNLE